MELIRQFKYGQHRLALVTALAMIVYLWHSSWSHYDSEIQELRVAFPYLFDGISVGFFSSLIQLILLLADRAIWVLSTFVAWSAYRKSKKKAYIFILAYFLLPMAVYPVSHVIQYYADIHYAQQIESLTAEQDLQLTAIEDTEHAELRPLVVDNIVYSVPLLEFMLLAGLWCLYKKEETWSDDTTTEPCSK